MVIGKFVRQRFILNGDEDIPRREEVARFSHSGGKSAIHHPVTTKWKKKKRSCTAAQRNNKTPSIVYRVIFATRKKLDTVED